MIVYLDTSALVKLYISEDGSERVDEAVRRADTVGTSLIAYPETLSAFHRRLRQRLYDRSYYNRMRQAFEKDWKRMHIIDLNRSIARSTGKLIHRHGLRGFDAIHVATALHFKLWLSAPMTFLCFDQKLSKAAKIEGLV